MQMPLHHLRCELRGATVAVLADLGGIRILFQGEDPTSVDAVHTSAAPEGRLLLSGSP